MNALVIENEFLVDTKVTDFLDEHKDKFESVTELICCLKRTPDEMLHYLTKYDTYILASSFMYTDQLNHFLNLFLKPEFPVKTIFVDDIAYRLNNWLSERYGSKIEYAELVKKVLDKGFIIYDYYDGKGGAIVYSQVVYSKEDNVFYHKDVTEDDMFGLTKQEAIENNTKK